MNGLTQINQNGRIGLRKQNPETKITRAIRSVLKSLGIFHWKNFGGPMCKPGVADLLGIKTMRVEDLVKCGVDEVGVFMAIEVKAPGGRLSAHQKVFLDNIKRAGGIAFKAESIDEVIDGLGERHRFLF